MKVHFPTRTTLASFLILQVLPCNNLHAVVIDSFTEDPFDYYETN
jgi:hypothetical protein